MSAEDTTLIDPGIRITAPGQLQVIRRNGKTTPYDANKIAIAMKKAFIAAEKNPAATTSTRISETVARLTKQIDDNFKRRWTEGSTIHIETIQDQVELILMRADEHKVLREYILYREEHRKAREQAAAPASTTPVLRITLKNGATEPLDFTKLKQTVELACEGLEDVQAEQILQDTERSLFDGVPISDVNTALIMATRTLIEKEPNYSYVAARLLINDLNKEALDFLGISPDLANTDLYTKILAVYIKKGVELELLDSRLLDFDLEKLAQALNPERNKQFTYLSLQTLYDRYFIHYQGTRFELPQIFFMRVAMGLVIQEKIKKEERAIEFYNILSSFDYISSTPTLFNSGTRRPQLSSCFLTTVPDDLKGIYGAIQDNALLSKFAGGLGNDWTPVRGMGAYIKGTNGKSSGVVPFLSVANATAIAVNQGGKRKGAVCAYLETWHMDIEEFLELRKNTGDERRRTHDMNTANWIPDLFMQRVFENKNWTLFSPNDVPDLHDLFGAEFEKAYVNYEQEVLLGKIHGKTISAVTLWRKMLGMLFETGHPWVTFKDSCNIRSPQQHVGVVHSSNLCTEITLNTSQDEIAVCNLGSINLVNHMHNGKLDQEKLQRTVNTAIRMLDNVIDINYYAVPQAKKSNLLHRPIGLGLMGFQDALYLQSLAYSSDDAVTFADHCMEAISYYAILASSDLAKERGSYATYSGSLWDQGILPIDSIDLLKQSRKNYLEINTDQTLNWNIVREKIKETGLRNSNIMAIAPTATISNICGVSQSIEPTYQNLYVKSNLSGEFTVINPYLVKDLKKLGLWDDVMVNDLKYYDGSVQKISRIPENLKKLYATAFEIDPLWLIEAASRRQKWIDQAQSLNLYMAAPSGKKLDALYKKAWLRGLKTTYYLRSLGASSTEKSTINTGALNAVNIGEIGETGPSCSIDNPDCEACQ